MSSRASILSSVDGKRSDHLPEATAIFNIPRPSRNNVPRISAPPKPPSNLRLTKQKTSVNLLKQNSIEVLEPKKHESVDQSSLLKLPDQVARDINNNIDVDEIESTAGLSAQNNKRDSFVSGLKQPSVNKGRTLKRMKTMSGPISQNSSAVKQNDSTLDQSSIDKD